MAMYEQGQLIAQDVLAHEQVTVTSSAAVGLPDPGVDWGKVRRVVVRTLGQPIDWRADGTAPDSAAFRALADEVIVLDFADFTKFQMKAVSTSADVRVAYFG